MSSDITDPAGVQTDNTDTAFGFFFNVKEQQAKQEVADIKAKIANIYSYVSQVRETHPTDQMLVDNLDKSLNECIDISYRCDNVSVLLTKIKDEYEP